MGRRAKPAKVKAEAKRALARKSAKDDGAKVRDLEKRLAEVLKREAEAREQQAATAEILRVISGSPTDVQPVFDAIVRSATRLCDADFSAVARFEGGLLRLVAVNNMSPAETAAYHTIFPRAPGRHFAIGRAFVDARPVHIEDIEADPDYDPWTRQVLQGAAVYRTFLGVPILENGMPIGAIGCGRHEMKPFTASQIELVKTFADQAVIAIENVRLFNETKEALEQQTATSEILRVISSSPTNLQPVLDTVSERAARLCEASDAVILLVEGTQLRTAAHHGRAFAPAVDRPVTRDGVAGRAVIDRATIHVPDVLAADDFPLGQRLSRADGSRTVLATPLMRETVAVGAILIRRQEVRPFSDQQIALLKTFADQAVIAIENVRLFNETKEALEQQTATSEILGVISQSPTDVQPVFAAIAESGRRLCGGDFCNVARYEGGLIHLSAHAHTTPEGVDALQRMFPAPPTRATTFGRTILERAIVYIQDIREDPEYSEALAEAHRARSGVGVPMLRDGQPIGAIVVGGLEARQFTDKQIALLQTFADQAVIAIENVRLFTELQASNRELTTALDTQTATSDILRVISRSQTNVQPVFDAIVDSAVRLLGAYSGALTRIAGDQIELAALTSTDDAGDAATRALFPLSLQFEGPHARAIRDRAPINITNAETDPRMTEALRAQARARRDRSWVTVPLLRHDEAVGTVSLTRREPGGFTDDEIALLQTFADQAVIAIENARLLSELQARTADLTRSVDELTALGDVGRILSSTLDLETVLQTIVTRANQLTGTAGCTIWEYDEAREEFRLRVSHYADVADAAVLQALGRVTTMRKGQGVTTQVVERRQPVQIRDIAAEGAYESPIRQPLIEAGHRALLGVPLLSEDEVIGVLAVTRKTPGEFEPEIVRLLSTFATQSALAIQNARLFLEIEDKSRQLEVASQHKSEFLANMSHELRTPLNAIIGFSEVLTERMFGELNEKQDEYLKDIYASGQHLLSLINDILDLSKIEAGRMELEPTDFDLLSAIDNALTLVRERAGRRGIALGRAIDDRVGTIRADERKVKQVLLNLLSNAIKYTPEGGRIDVRADVSDGVVEVSVADTGVGIAPEDQEAVFEEFRQVGTADKKVEGTGLGLALSRKFIELHGGRIRVKSEVGQGSTFTFTLPVRS